MDEFDNPYPHPSVPKIYIALASSITSQELFIIDYYHFWTEQDPVDGYRLVIELINNIWVEKSLTPVY
jgi:hypothetical protein